MFQRIEEAVAQGVREQYAAGVAQQLDAMSQDQLAAMLDMALAGGASPSAMAVQPFSDWQFVYLYDHYMPPTRSSSTYEDNLDLLGYVRLDSPSAISIYATTFVQKDEIADLIKEYNAGVSEEEEITYTDYVALLMSSITGIISGDRKSVV